MIVLPFQRTTISVCADW